jgi:hypothetical protein
MGENTSRLKELKEDLDRTYEEMKDILVRNNLPRRMVANLPDEEYARWNNLNKKTIHLINEFVIELGKNIK